MLRPTPRPRPDDRRRALRPGGAERPPEHALTADPYVRGSPGNGAHDASATSVFVPLIATDPVMTPATALSPFARRPPYGLVIAAWAAP
jgi:hypothetical protein